MAEKDYSLPFMSAEVAKDKKNVDILTGSPLNTKNPTTLNEVEEDYYIYQYPNTLQDRFTDRDYDNETYPILNDIEFQADLEKIISNNVLTKVGLRALMEKTGGNLSKVLQNYTSSKRPQHLPDEDLKNETMGEVGSTGSPPDKTKEAPYDYNARYVDDESNPLYLLNPKIRINLSDLADQDSALQTQWRKTKKDPTPDNLNSLRGLLNVSSYGNKNTPISQANVISHELMHFAIIELYNKGLLDKATIEKLREDNSLSITGDNEIEELFISKMTKEKDLENDPAFKGMFPSKAIFGDLKSKFDDTKLQNRIESAAETWLKTYSPPVQNQVAPEDQGNSFGRTSNTTPYTGKLPGRLRNSIIEEEMYDGAIPAGLAKGGDIMPMEQQMEMFAVGGLDDDGLSRDPVSGNEIPPGSMANEVRDDVEARLSDGEYVVPANVVRFFGVKFFEDLRTQAMQGLSDMEANGRIGGEPVPSDMPMQDQMAEIQPDVSDEEMQMLQGLMNEGGYVRGYAPGGAVVPKDVDLENPSNYPFNPSPFSTVGASFFSPYNPNVTSDPNLPPTTMPVTPSPESGISFVTMVNPATGEIQVVQFMGGNPVDANAYNQLLSSGYFVQGSQELAAYKQQQNEDNRKADEAMGGAKPKSINDLLSGDLYGDMSLGLGAKLAGSVLNKAFPTKSNQNILDYIMDNRDPVTGESRFPPSGRGIPLKDAAGNIVYNAGGTPKFQTDKNGFILRSEGKDGPRNVAKEEVARIFATMEIKKANTNSKGVLNNRAYRDALKKAGLAEGVGLTTKFVDPADWYKTDGGIAAIANVNAAAKKIVTDDLEATEKKFTPTYDTKSKTYKYGSDDKDDGFVVTDPKTGKTKDYRFGVVKDPTDLSAFDTTTILPPEDNDNNNTTSGGSNNNNQSVDAGGLTQPEREKQNKQQDKETSSQGVVDRLADREKSGGGRRGFKAGGLLKKPTKKKTKTKK